MATNYEEAAGVGLAILIVTQIPQIYQTMMPYPNEIESHHPDERYCQSVSSSNVFTAGIAIALGFGGSLITQTPWPFFGALIITALMWHRYNKAVKFDPTGIY